MSFDNIKELNKTLKQFIKNLKTFKKQCGKISATAIGSINQFKKSFDTGTIELFTDFLREFNPQAKSALHHAPPTEGSTTITQEPGKS